MDIKKYRIFVRAAELGSFTRAAEELGLTQSGVSHALAELEEELGFRLLSRGRSGAALTAGADIVVGGRTVSGGTTAGGGTTAAGSSLESAIAEKRYTRSLMRP